MDSGAYACYGLDADICGLDGAAVSYWRGKRLCAHRYLLLGAECAGAAASAWTVWLGIRRGRVRHDFGGPDRPGGRRSTRVPRSCLAGAGGMRSGGFYFFVAPVGLESRHAQTRGSFRAAADKCPRLDYGVLLWRVWLWLHYSRYISTGVRA